MEDMQFITINSENNYGAFGFANWLLVSQVVAILRDHSIKVKMEDSLILLKVDKNLRMLLLGNLPTENLDRSHFDELAAECREEVVDEAISYYNVLLKLLRDRIRSIPYVALYIAKLESVKMEALLTREIENS